MWNVCGLGQLTDSSAKAYLYMLALLYCSPASSSSSDCLLAQVRNAREESCCGVSAMQVINAVAVVFVWFVMVETKQRSLAQIQAQLVGSS